MTSQAQVDVLARPNRLRRGADGLAVLPHRLAGGDGAECDLVPARDVGRRPQPGEAERGGGRDLGAGHGDVIGGVQLDDGRGERCDGHDEVPQPLAPT